jgi:phage gpG-like protein
MDLKEFRNQIQAMGRKLEDLAHRKMPVIVGQMAVSHFKNNFRQGGFVNNGLNQWKPSQRIGKGKGAGSNYKTLLSGRNHLYSSMHYIPGDAKVTVKNNVEYAAIHNEGGTLDTHPSVTPKMRKFAWAKYYEALGVKRGGKIPKGMSIPEDAARWRGLALTKKSKLNIKVIMPKRQFIGESKELNDKIEARWETEISKIINI